MVDWGMCAKEAFMLHHILHVNIAMTPGLKNHGRDAATSL